MSDDLIDPGQDPGQDPNEPEASWLDSLPEDFEYRDDPSLSTVPDVPTLAKSYVETKKLVGRKGLIVPKDDEPEEKWDEFYGALGRPETADNYEFDRPDLPDGLDYSEDFEKDFRARAHDLGISQKQAKGLYDWFVPQTIQWSEASRESLVKAKEELETQWGDKFEANTKLAHEAFKKYAAPEDYQTMLEGPAPLGNDPRLVRIFHKVGLSMKEDKFVTGKGTASHSIDEQIIELEKNPALYDATHPEQKALQAKRDALYKQKYPDK
jgi:hypothetical protein